MIITHDAMKCLNCGKELILEDDDFANGEVACPYCGYTNDFSDVMAEFYEIDF